MSLPVAWPLLTFIVVPGVFAWWTARRLVRRPDDPALAERLLARTQHTQRVTVLSCVCMAFGAGPYYWLAVLALIVGLWIGDYPSRRVLLAERGVHRPRPRAAQRARAGGRLRARSRASRALHLWPLSARLRGRLRARRDGYARRRLRARLAAGMAVHGVLVLRADRGPGVEKFAAAGPRDGERRASARAVRGRRGARQRAHEADHGGPDAAALERRARARLVASEPRAPAARDSPRGRGSRQAVRRHGRHRDDAPDGARGPRPRRRGLGGGAPHRGSRSRAAAPDRTLTMVGAVRRAGRAARACRLVGRRLAHRARSQRRVACRAHRAGRGRGAAAQARRRRAPARARYGGDRAAGGGRTLHR